MAGPIEEGSIDYKGCTNITFFVTPDLKNNLLKGFIFLLARDNFPLDLLFNVWLNES